MPSRSRSSSSGRSATGWFHEDSLQPLFIQIASIQLVALPAVIVAYGLDPLYTPVAFAAVGGAHFLPYTWLQRTPIYGILAVVVAVSPYLLLGFGALWVFHATGFILGTALLIGSGAVWMSAPHRKNAVPSASRGAGLVSGR